MDRIEKPADELRTRRVLMAVTGIALYGVGAGMFGYSGMGADPLRMFAQGLGSRTPLSFGTVYVLINAALLLLMFVTDRKKIGPGTVLNLFLPALIADASLAFWKWLIPYPSAASCVAFLGVGILVMCLAAALYYTADLGVSVYDSAALTLAEKQSRVPFRWCRVGTDLACAAAGFALGRSIGVATIAAALLTGPLISVFIRAVGEPLLYPRTRKRPA